MSTHWNNTIVTARKEHQCDLCARVIRAGEQYERGAGMDGARAWTFKECAHCRVLIAFLISNHGTDFWYDDDCGYTSTDVSEGWEPTLVNELRVKAMWSRKWTKTDGTLCLLPEVEKEERTMESGHVFTKYVAISMPSLIGVAA